MNYKKIFCNKNWKVKLPIIVGISYFIISLPFILNLATPLIHDGSIISTFYILINIPANLFFELFFPHETICNYDFISLLISLIFWICFSAVIGWIIDFKNKELKLPILKLILVPIIPVIARIIFFPIEMLTTLHLFGCGCNPGFNANKFSFFFVLPLVGGISLLEFIRTARLLKGIGKWIFIIICLACQISTGYVCWYLIVWA